MSQKITTGQLRRLAGRESSNCHGYGSFQYGLTRWHYKAVRGTERKGSCSSWLCPRIHTPSITERLCKCFDLTAHHTAWSLSSCVLSLSSSELATRGSGWTGRVEEVQDVFWIPLKSLSCFQCLGQHWNTQSLQYSVCTVVRLDAKSTFGSATCDIQKDQLPS